MGESAAPKCEIELHSHALLGPRLPVAAAACSSSSGSAQPDDASADTSSGETDAGGSPLDATAGHPDATVGQPDATVPQGDATVGPDAADASTSDAAARGDSEADSEATDAGPPVWDGSPSYCGAWTALAASTSAAFVGDTLTLTATATGSEPSDLGYTWSQATADGGTIGVFGAASDEAVGPSEAMSFLCTSPGTATITLVVDEGPPPDGGSQPQAELSTVTTTVTCNPARRRAASRPRGSRSVAPGAGQPTAAASSALGTPSSLGPLPPTRAARPSPSTAARPRP